MKSRNRLLTWIYLWWIGPSLLVFFASDWVSGVLTTLLMGLPYPHGTVKWVLESSQGLLLHQSSIIWVAVAGLIAGAFASFRPKQRALGLILCGSVALLVPHYGLLEMAILGLGLLVVWWPNQPLSQRTWPLWVFPMLPIFVPSILLSVGQSIWIFRLVVILRSLSSMMFMLMWFWGDRLSHYEEVRADISDWPEHMLDPEIRQLAKSPTDVRADWHGIRILGETAIVSCEREPRLTAFSLTSDDVHNYPLLPRWGPDFAGPLESEVYPESNTVWTIDGGDKLRELQWTGAGWELLDTHKLPVSISFAYITKREGELLLVTVQAANRGPRRVLKVSLPEGRPIRNIRITQREGLAPMPREILWVPTIDKLVIAPDFGTHLYTVDLNTGVTEPWIEVPTLNGKMLWDEGAGRIILALPNQREVWVIDPHGPFVERKIPTQPGVRAIALDHSRNLLLTASVVTGQVWVQDAQDGTVKKRLGTVYPMVRELAVSEPMGQAVLTTWAAVYQIDYVP